MYRIALLMFILFSFTTTVLAQYGNMPKANMPTPPNVNMREQSSDVLFAKQRTSLSGYCRLDFEGTRLQPDSWSRFKPYTSMRDSPRFGRIVIVTRFDVDAPSPMSDILTVSYQTVGYYQIGGGYMVASGSERVEFQMEEQGDRAMVVTVGTPIPHVSRRAAMTWMNLLLADPKTSESERERLNGALVQLNRLLPQAHQAAYPPGS